MLLCADDSFYTGMTNWLARRLEEHDAGINDTSFTFGRRPLKLVYSEMHQYVNNAIAREKQIKKWSRAKKIALMKGDINSLKKLSACRNLSHYLNHSYHKGISGSPEFMPVTIPRTNENIEYLKDLRFAGVTWKQSQSRESGCFLLFP
jgi:putative endonuclease